MQQSNRLFLFVGGGAACWRAHCTCERLRRSARSHLVPQSGCPLLGPTILGPTVPGPTVPGVCFSDQRQSPGTQQYPDCSRRSFSPKTQRAAPKGGSVRYLGPGGPTASLLQRPVRPDAEAAPTSSWRTIIPPVRSSHLTLDHLLSVVAITKRLSHSPRSAKKEICEWGIGPLFNRGQWRRGHNGGHNHAGPVLTTTCDESLRPSTCHQTKAINPRPSTRGHQSRTGQTWTQSAPISEITIAVPS